MEEKEYQISIPNNPEELRKLVLSLSKKVDTLESDKDSLQQKNDRLQERVTLLKLHIFTRRSEKITAEDRQQMYLFDEEETVAVFVEESILEEKPENKKSSEKKGRRPIPANIPRERVVHDLNPEDKVCSCCGKNRLKDYHKRAV